jgi:predicted AAA+ superfamily ATPase
MIPRIIADKLAVSLKEQKVVLISGPRKCGKRTLIQSVLDPISERQAWFTMSDKKLRETLQRTTADNITLLMGNAEYIVIEEAQYLENLQEIIEMVLSGVLSSTLVLSCSFRPDMDEVLVEAMKQQHLEYRLYPLSFYEIAKHLSLPEVENNLQHRIIYGAYPEIVAAPHVAEERLVQMLEEVIFTDLGVTDRINKEDKLIKMLQQLAFNISVPVSYNEIGEKSGLDNETVERYTDLLVEAGLLVRLPSFFNGHRYELKKTHLIYFMDNGIRNALIRNFNPPELRNDMEALWKNLVITERIKWNRMHGREPHYCFWSTHTKQSMDFLEIYGEEKHAYRISWDKKKKIRYPRQFCESYPYIALHALNRSTYWGFLTKK